MKVLVTGAAGFIGSHLAESLLLRGDQVVAIDNFNDYYDPTRKRANVRTWLDAPGLAFFEGDIRDKEFVHQVLAEHQPDAIAHLAAMAGVRYSMTRGPLYADVNVGGTANLLESCRELGIPHFVFASTSSVYGQTEIIPFVEEDACNHPLAPYPATKKAGELLGYSYFQLFGISFTAVRFFSVYGPRGRPDMMPFMTMHRIVHEQEIQLYDAGQMQRDWTYVKDIVSGIVAAIDRPLGYGIVNLGRGEPVLMSDFVRYVETLVGKKAILSTPPAPASEPKITYADISKARSLLDYSPQTPVQDGLSEMWDWYKAEILASSDGSRS